MDSYQDLGFAKLDLSRSERTGMEESVFCEGKTPQQLVTIFQTFKEAKKSVLGTRCSVEQAEALQQAMPEVIYESLSRTLQLRNKTMPVLNGKVAICSAGTADLPVAEEAAQTIEFFGGKVERFWDVGVAGLHRLLNKISAIREAQVVIAVAGMEGALASVLAGLVSVPVIAVPTSVGYGTSFGGLSALLTMLNSCAEGLSVVNIDNGYGAGIAACRILRTK